MIEILYIYNRYFEKLIWLIIKLLSDKICYYKN